MAEQARHPFQAFEAELAELISDQYSFTPTIHRDEEKKQQQAEASQRVARLVLDPRYQAAIKQLKENVVEDPKALTQDELEEAARLASQVMDEMADLAKKLGIESTKEIQAAFQVGAISGGRFS